MRYFYTILSVTALCFLINQQVASQDFSIGGGIGLGLSSQSNWDYRSSGSDSKKRSQMPGLIIDVSAKYKFSKLLGVQAGLQYVQKGEIMKITGSTGSETKVKTCINYLTLPILVNISHSFGKIVVYGEAGPYFGLGLSAKSVLTGSAEGKDKIEFGKGQYRRFDMGLCIGAGVGYPLGPGQVLLDLRYDIGFIDVNSTLDEYKGSNYKSTCNRTFGISVGYMIPIGKKHGKRTK